MKNVFVFVLKLYKSNISPILTRLFGNACRFTPTCSEYTIEAVEKHGLLKGAVMGVRRLSRCHPWGGQGFDPVA